MNIFKVVAFDADSFEDILCPVIFGDREKAIQEAKNTDGDMVYVYEETYEPETGSFRTIRQVYTEKRDRDDD